MDRIKLLCDIGELNHLFRDSVSVEDFFEHIVVMVTQHMKTEVCSIYLYDDDTEELMLKATEGLHPDAVEHVKMKIGEGLTGLALKEMRPVCVTKASKHENYKQFIGMDEEIYDNFLAVPIVRGVSRIGVLVLQRKKRRKFNESDVLACKAVASQLANIIENAKFLMSMHGGETKKQAPPIAKEDYMFIRGKVASEGYAYSKARVVDRQRTFTWLLKVRFKEKYTLEDFEKAVESTSLQLQGLQKQVEEKLSDAASLIFSSHLLILKDKEFVGAMARHIEQGQNPPDAILRIAKEYINVFAISENHYIREKIQDVEDLTVRLIGNLVREFEDIGDYADRVVVARQLFPSDLLSMSSQKISGIVLVGGGVTSHLSILARSLQIPMVIANYRRLMDVDDKSTILVDADAGNVYVNPTEEIVLGFDKRNKARLEATQQIVRPKSRTLTADKTEISLMANINLLSDVKLAKEMHCTGVGLYRTEFPFIIRSDFPTEQEQFITYSKLFDSMKGSPVVFRTLDIGGDKVLSYYHNANEQNPCMGMRSIRFSLQNQDVFKTQLRAILRAGAGADLRVMFPMISAIDEFNKAKKLLCECIDELTSENIPHNNRPQIGIMVELPSVIHLIDDFAKIVDFFSIGTNDLIQFMLGADRTNEIVESFYLPGHPAVLRGINAVAESALKHGIGVSVCGDMSHMEEFMPFLLGIGIRTLSLEPAYIPRIQQAIAKINIAQAQEKSKSILNESNTAKIAEMLHFKSGAIRINKP